jgi:DNA-binding HxlR family transcriptional regulator
MYNGRVIHNPVEFVLLKLGGTWKMPILWWLREGPKRFSELKKILTFATAKMLTSQLRELEKDGFIHRKIYAEIPPHTEYTLTEKGTQTLPLIETIREYGVALMKDEGIEQP